MVTSPEATNEFLRNYLKAATILIVDAISSARVGVKKILSTMGATSSSIHLASSIEEAEGLIREKKPTIIFCEYQIGGKYGLELFQKQRKECAKESTESIFILITGNTSQSAVAEAAEEDVDGYILKPYTINNFTACLVESIETKTHPSEYLKLIFAGKKQLESLQLAESITTFSQAISQDPKPALALSYLGQAYFKSEKFDLAEENFRKGLEHNPTHYQCLVGLIDLLIATKKRKPAYEIVQQLVSTFPINQNRLAMVLKLAIQTGNYADVETFYQEFLKIDDRTEELVKCVCAALIVCGRYFFESQDSTKGADLIQKASVTAAGRTFLLKKCIEAFVQYDQLDGARQALKRFPETKDETPNYAAASLLIQTKETPPDQCAGRGQELLNKGIVDPEIYVVTINSFEKIGKIERAQELRKEAIRLYPDLAGKLKK